MVGVSAGAINVAHLASFPGDLDDAVEELSHLWRKITTEQIFRIDNKFFLENVVRWAGRLVSGGRTSPLSTKGLVDTTPLRTFLRDKLHTVGGSLKGIQTNLETGRLNAAALTTTNYSTGRAVTWVQGQQIRKWERPDRTSRNTALGVDHVMASAALPLFFPAVRIRSAWYGDGGIRQTAPLSPAIHLGARQIMTISTRYDQSAEEADSKVVHGYPPPAQIGGILMESVFLNLLHQDAANLRRINRLIRHVPADQREGMRVIDLLIMRPSVDLSALSRKYEPELPSLFRYLLRGLGAQESERPDWLSMLMFESGYIKELIQIGQSDARARHDEIEAFLEDK
jgi:NTE family protein